MKDLTEALQAVRDLTHENPPEWLELSDAWGRMLAEDVVSLADAPPFDKSMVDGFAVRTADVTAGHRLEVIEEIMAGQTPQHAIAAGQAARIMTGAQRPEGADAIVMREHVTEHADGVCIAEGEVRPGQHIMRRATVAKQGQTVLTTGRLLRSVDIGILADVGRAHVNVVRPPTVTLIQTGDELVPPGEARGPSQITNSNGPLLESLVRACGALPDNLQIVVDQVEPLQDAMRQGLSSDFLVVSGGVSQGDRDLVPGVLESLGVRQVFHRVKLRPGKPVWFGVLEADDPTTLVFGLPGNPVSGLVCFLLFVAPAIRFRAGQANAWDEPRASSCLTTDHHVHGVRPTFWPGRRVHEGRSVQPLAWHGSADPYTLADADCFIFFPQGDRHYRAGEAVELMEIEPSRR